MMNLNAKTRSINLTVLVVLLPILFNFAIFFYSIFAKIPFGGSKGYGTIAYHLVDKGKYSLDGVNDTFVRPPLYPLFLVLPRALSEQHWQVCARFLQCLLGIMCSLMVFRIANRVSGNRLIGLLSEVLYLSHLAVQAEHYAQRETVLFELILLSLVYVLLTKEILDVKTVVIASLLSSALYLTRPTGILFLLVTLLVAFCQSRTGKRIKYLLVSVVVFVVTISPWQFYNYRAFSKITLSSSNSTGLNLYKGASPVIQSIFPQIDVDYAGAYVARKLRSNGIHMRTEEYRANAFFIKEAKRLVVQYPGHFFKKMFKQLFSFYSQVFTPFGRGRVVVDGERLIVQDYRFTFGLVELNHFVVMTILIPFGMFELVKMSGVTVIEHRFKVVSLLIFLFMTIVHMLTFAETRFRLPLDGLLCVATGLFFAKHLSDRRLTLQKEGNSEYR